MIPHIKHSRGPGWPDFRGWAAIGFFGLAFYSMWMIDHNPALLGVPSFMQFIGGLATGGVLLVASHLFGGTKSGAETNAKLAEAVGTKPPPLAGTMTATIEATAKTEDA